VTHAVRILRVLQDASSPLGLSEITRQVGLSRGSVHPILVTLIDEGLVTQNDTDATYARGWGLWALGADLAGRVDMFGMATSRMPDLAEELGETVLLSVMESDRLRYIAQRRGPRAIGVSIAVGSNADLHSTAAGKALLAFSVQGEAIALRVARKGLARHTSRTLVDLDELIEELAQTRSRGYGVALGEDEAELNAVAVPIFDASGEVVAALSAAGPSHRFDQSHLAEAAARLSAVVGAQV
jgi:DNA-binding IclR family transcriptional regulator